MKTKRYPAIVRMWKEAGTCDARVISAATRRGHKHFHNATTKPSYTRPSKLTPAQYRRQHKGKQVKEIHAV